VVRGVLVGAAHTKRQTTLYYKVLCGVKTELHNVRVK